MAAVTLVGAPFPSIRRQVNVTTALQAFTLPRDCRQVTVSGDAALWVQFTGADAGVVSTTAAFPVAANGAATFMLTNSPDHRATSVLVAAQSGTATVYVVCEGAS